MENKDLAAITPRKKAIEYLSERAGLSYPTPKNMRDFLQESDKKERPIIKYLVPEKSITTIFGEPGTLKSILASHIGCCVATGKKFLGQYPVKKGCVLILSTENSEKTDKKRLRAIFKGMKVNPVRRKIKNLQLLIYGRNTIDLLSNLGYYANLEKTIANNNIKLLIIDTLSPMISEIDDNRASSIVDTFKKQLFPLIDKFQISIILIMHSQKTGRDFLGSVKYKASVDAFYELSRKDDILELLCHKHREGEHNLKIKASFEEKKEKLNKITFEFLEEYAGKQSAKNKENNPALIEQIKTFILNELQVKELQYGEIIKNCISKGFSKTTSRRGINSLYELNKIAKKQGKNGGYYIV